MQPGNTYNNSEPDPALQSVIATLSMGPVMPGDGIPFINASLVMRSVRKDGMVLKPDFPAVYPNSLYVRKAWGEAPASDYTSVTFVQHGPWVWAIALVLTIHGAPPAPLTVREALPYFARGPQHANARFLVTTSEQHTEAGVEGDLQEVGMDDVFTRPPAIAVAPPVAAAPTWQLSTLTPVIALSSNLSVALVGEMGKHVTVSAQRMRDLRVSTAGISATLMGAGGETVPFVLAWRSAPTAPWTPVLTTCTITAANTVVWSWSVSSPSHGTCTGFASRASAFSQ